MTGLDEVKTNIIAARILADVQREAPHADIILKMALQSPKNLPEPLRGVRVHLHSKVRLHNSEIVVRIDKEGQSIDDLMSRVAYVVHRSNQCRERMDMYNVFPGQNLSEYLQSYRPPVLQLCGSVHSNTTPPQGGSRRLVVPKRTSIEIDLEGTKLKAHGGHVDQVVSIGFTEVSDLTFTQAVRHILRRRPWLGEHVVKKELAGMALSLGHDPEEDVKNVCF